MTEFRNAREMLSHEKLKHTVLLSLISKTLEENNLSAQRYVLIITGVNDNLRIKLPFQEVNSTAEKTFPLDSSNIVVENDLSRSKIANTM